MVSQLSGEKDSQDKIDPLKIVYGDYGQENIFKTNVSDTKEITHRPFSFFLLSHYHTYLS